MDVNDHVKTSGLRRKATLNVTFCVKKERNASFKKVSRILQKSESERSEEEKEVLSSCSEVVKEVSSRLEKRKVLKARSEEVEDTQEVLEVKCETLARAVQRARHLVVYSGAGVSTAACIPDYRGSNGIWTRLQQGLDIGQHDLSKTQPTLTHMVLYALYKRGMLKHVVSQNCDGLHLRSGLPRAALSEVHGNMYLEVCQPCKVEYWRLFDVTEHTGRYSHATARRCYTCHKPLRDTIVHFGERGGLKWPINWSGATAAANQADVILCIGSSLKVLKRYPWLWGMDRPAKKRPSLYIVNLQWTPKDEQAALKINGKCDEVMRLMMSRLSLTIPDYDPLLDPIFVHATRLHPVEMHTYSTAALEPPDGLRDDSIKRPAGTSEVSPEIDCKRLCENRIIKTEPVELMNSDEKKNKIEEDKKYVKEGNTVKKYVKEENTVKEEQSVLVNKDKQRKKNDEEESQEDKQNNCKGKDEVQEKPLLEADKTKDLKLASNLNKVEKVLTTMEDDKDNIFSEDKKTDIKEEPKEAKKTLDSVKAEPKEEKSDEPKKVSPGKSPTKGIWRPFSFDDSESSSSSAMANIIELKPEPASSTTSSSDLLNLVGNSSCNISHSPNSVKKCLVQLEPLDLSCGKTRVPVIEKPNPYLCKYCRTYYHSGFCLFYRKNMSENPPDPPCYCCDEEEEKDPLSPETDVKSPDDSDKSNSKTPITNPGWFGKGYRKKIRKKR